MEVRVRRGRHARGADGVDPVELSADDLEAVPLNEQDTQIRDVAAVALEVRRDLARKLADEARAKAAAASSSLHGAPTQPPAPTRQASGLARRAARPKTAHEALQEARRAEAERKEQARREAEAARRVQNRSGAPAAAAPGLRTAPLDTRKDAARAAREIREQQAREEAALAARDRATFAARDTARPRPKSALTAGPLDALLVEERVTHLLEGLGRSIEVLEVFVGVPDAVVRPLWRAHGLRARQEGDLALAVAAEAVHRALTEHPEHVAAARVRSGGRDWAVWVEVDAQRVLAALTPDELYLVGL